MGRFDAVLKDPEYIKLNEAQKKQVWEGLFRKHVATDKDYLALDEVGKEETYQGFIGKYYSPQQPAQPLQDIFKALKPVEPTASPVESLRVPGIDYDTDKANAVRQKVMEARQKRDQIEREIQAGNPQSGIPVAEAKDFVSVNGMDVPRSEWNKLRLKVANADLQPNNYTDPVEFNVVKGMEREERASQSQREIQRLQKQIAETDDPDLLPIIADNLKKQELLQEFYITGMTKVEREGYAFGKETAESGTAQRLFGSFGKGSIDSLTGGLITLLAPDSKLARYLSAYEQGIQAPTGRPIEDAFTSLAASAPLTMGFFIGGLAPAATRGAINKAMSTNMLLNTQGRKFATAYARYGSATATPDTAIAGGVVSAVLETAIETFSDVAQTNIVLGLTKRSGKKAAQNYVRKELSQRIGDSLKRYGLATLESAGTEAAEELLQTAQDMVVDVITKQREVPTLEEAVKEIGYATAVGGLGGLTFGLLGGTVRPFTEFQTWRNVNKQAAGGDATAKRLMEARKLIERGKEVEALAIVKDDLKAVTLDNFKASTDVTQAMYQMHDAYSVAGMIDTPITLLMESVDKAMKDGADGEAVAQIVEAEESVDAIIAKLEQATSEIKQSDEAETQAEAIPVVDTQYEALKQAADEIAQKAQNRSLTAQEEQELQDIEDEMAAIQNQGIISAKQEQPKQSPLTLDEAQAKQYQDLIGEEPVEVEPTPAKIADKPVNVKPKSVTSKTPLAEQVKTVVDKKKAWQMTQKEMLTEAEKEYLKRNPKQITGSESKTVIDEKTGKKRNVVTKYIEEKTKITNEIRKSFIELHKSSIINALKRGDKVASEVLAEYPGLTADTVLTTVEKANTSASTVTEIKPEVKAEKPKAAKPKPAVAEKKYSITVIDKESSSGMKMKEVANAKTVTREQLDYPELDLFIHRENYEETDPKKKGGWVISSNLTGQRASEGKTLKEAIAKAKVNLEKAKRSWGAKTNKEFAKLVIEKNKQKLAENEAKYAEDKETEKLTYLMTDRMDFGRTDSEREAYHKEMASRLEKAKAEGYIYYAYNKSDISDKKSIDDEIRDHKVKAKLVAEPDAFKRNVMSWVEYNSLDGMKKHLRFLKEQLAKPNSLYRNKSNEELQQEIDVIKEAIKQKSASVQPTPTDQPTNNNDIKSIIDKIDSGEIAPILHIKGVANEIDEMYKFVIDGVTYSIYPENTKAKSNISEGTIIIDMLVKASPEMDKLLGKYDGEAVKEAIYAENPNGYAYPTFYSLSDAILFSRENHNIVKTNLAAYKERLKTTGIQDYTSTPTEPSAESIFIRKLTKAEMGGGKAYKDAIRAIPEKEGYSIAYKPYGMTGERADAGYYYIKTSETTEPKPLTKAQKVIANQIKEQAKTKDEFNPEAFEKKLDKLADALGNITVAAKKTGGTVTFNIDNVDSGQKINIKATKDGYEIDSKTFSTDAKAYEYVATIAGETDARHKALTEGQAEAERQMEAVRKQYEGTEQWMKAPNGKPTKLNERQWLQVRTPNFLNWFGDWMNDPKNASKVVDENGEPMVVYHSTDGNFNIFDITKARSYTGNPDYDLPGFYFTQRKEFADDYGARRISAYLNFKNPFTFELNAYKRQNGLKTWRSVYDKIMADGYDGVIVSEGANNSEEEYISLVNTQIKSATANTGEFSAENPDIRYSPTADYQTANLIYKSEPTSIEGITRAISTVIPKQWIKSIDTEGESARITFQNGREIMINALTGMIADENGNPIAIGKTTINRSVGQGSNIIAIIDIAKNYNDGNITAYHEGFHLAFNLMLTEAEQAVVFKHYSGKNASELTQAERIAAEEMAAKDFEYLMKNGTPPAPAKVQGIFRRLWESIRIFVRKLMGKDFYDSNFQILERIAKGEADSFNYNARDYFNNAADEALYRKIKDPLEGVTVSELEMKKAKYKIEQISDRVLDITRNLSDFGVKVTAVYNKTKSEEKRQLLIKKFADYLEQALPYLPGFTKIEVADMVRSINKVKTITSFMRALAMVERKINRRYARKLYPAMESMLKSYTKIPKQRDTLSRKRSISDDALARLNYIKEVFYMTPDKAAAELIRLSTLNEEVESNTAISPDAVEVANTEVEWKTRYLGLFSGLKRTGKSKSGKDVTIYDTAERMAVAYEEIRSLISSGKSMMKQMDAKRKAEQNRLIRQTIVSLVGNKFYGDGIETRLERFQKSKGFNPVKKAGEYVKKGSDKLLYHETIIQNMDFVALKNHEGMKEYRITKEREFNEAIENAENPDKIPLMEFNRDQYLAALDDIIAATANYKGLFKGWFEETYFKPMYQAYRDKNAGLTQYTKIIHTMRVEVAQEIFGKNAKGIADYLPAMMSSTLQNISISLLDPQSGKRIDTRISMQALGTIYAYSLNPDYADNVKNTGFDDEAMQQMMKIFSESKAGRYMQRWVERVTYEFYPMYYDTINDVYKERNGFSLGKELIYTPAVMDVKDKIGAFEIGNPTFSAMETFGINLASHIARVKNNVGFKLSELNFDALLTNHIHNNEHYKAYAMPMYNARTTILSQPVLATIDAVLGESQRRALTSYYRDIAANGFVKQDVSNLVNRWMSNMSMAYLSFSPKVALKQVSSFAYAAAYMSPAEFAQNIAWVISNPQVMARIIRKSPTFNIRYKEGITSEQYLYLHLGSASSFNRLFRQTVGKYGNWSRYGDQLAAVLGGGAIYRKEYLRLEKENPTWTAKQLEDAAVYELELFVDRTQQSANTQFVPQLRREGSIWRLLTQFKTQKFAMYNALYNAVSELKYNKSNLDKALWMLIVLTMILPVMEWLGDMGFTEPASPWDMALGGAGQLIEMIPLTGEIASGIMLWAAKGEVPDYSRIIPAAGGIVGINQGLKKIDRAVRNYEAYGEVDLMPLFEGIAAVAAPTTGMPIHPILQNAKGWESFTSGDDKRIQLLFGYSKGLLDYAEKTYGKGQE